VSIKERAITRLAEAGGRLRVRSALNPILWLCLIISLPAITCLPFLAQPPTWYIVLAFAPVFAAIFGFLFLLIYDRDKLQSEDYQIRKRQLEIIEEKGRPTILAETIPAISDPGSDLLSD
jgi:hypothetical protein